LLEQPLTFPKTPDNTAATPAAALHITTMRHCKALNPFFRFEPPNVTAGRALDTVMSLDQDLVQNCR
jgi:hypothetical protein